MGKWKGKDDTLLMKKQTEQEQSSTTTVMSVDGKEIFWKSFSSEILLTRIIV